MANPGQATELPGSDVACNTLTVREGLTVGGQPITGGQANVFVWESAMSWATVYATVNDGHPWIVLVEPPQFGAFRLMTKEIAGPTNLWNLLLVAGWGQAFNLGARTIRSEVGLTIGVDPVNGIAMMQSQNIKWEFFTSAGPIATGVPVAVSLDGGTLQHNDSFCFETDQFLCSLQNNATITGAGGTARLVRLLGNLSVLYLAGWATVGGSVFGSTTGAFTIAVNTDWTVRALSGTAFQPGANPGVTPVFSQNQAHAISPNGTLWTLEVTDAGALVIS